MNPAWLRHLPLFARRHLEGRTYLQRVISNTGWLLVERTLRYTIGFLVGVWIARHVGPEQYGLLNYAGAVIVVLAFMSTLGLDALAVRDIVRDPAARDETVGTVLVLRLAGGLLMVLAAAAIAYSADHGDPRAAVMIMLISVAQLLQAFDSLDCWFQAVVASRYTVFARMTALLTMTAVRIALIVTHAPLVAFAWAILAESTVLALAMLVVYRRSGQRIGAWRATMARAAALLREGWPLMLSALVAAASLRIDHVMLGQMAGFAEVGAYAIAVRIVEVSFVIPAVVIASVFPAMISAKQQDRVTYEARIQALFDSMLWSALAIAVPLSLLAGVVVRVLAGNAYAAAGPVLEVLAWMPVLVFLGVIRQRWLLAENQLGAGLAVEAAGCGLNVLANLVLIPRHGAVGAAYASLIGSAFATVLVAPFSSGIRNSLTMYLSAAFAPLRILRRLAAHR